MVLTLHIEVERITMCYTHCTTDIYKWNLQSPNDLSSLTTIEINSNPVLVPSSYKSRTTAYLYCECTSRQTVPSISLRDFKLSATLQQSKEQVQSATWYAMSI